MNCCGEHGPELGPDVNTGSNYRALPALLKILRIYPRPDGLRERVQYRWHPFYKVWQLEVVLAKTPRLQADNRVKPFN